MSFVIFIIAFITAVYHMISVRSKAKKGLATDIISGGEKVYIWIVSFINPVWAGAVFYYGWKKILPNKAKQANSISFWVFFIWIIFGVMYFVLFPQPKV